MNYLERLKENHPELVAEYSAMSKEQLLEQICAEVLDLHAMEDRVQLFMSECTDGMSKTNYTLESLKSLITNKQQKDISEFCLGIIEDYDFETDTEIANFIREQV